MSAPLGIRLPWSTGAAAWLEDARAAEEAGFAFVAVTGDPDPFTLLAAAAGATRRIRLVAAVPSDVAEPYELARRLASLDHLSGGRAGWLLSGAGTARARSLVAATGTLLESWRGDEIVASGGTFVSRPDPGRFQYRDPQFDIAGLFSTPPGPQRHPVLLGRLHAVAVTAADDPAGIAARLGGPGDGVLLDPDGPVAAQVALGVPALLP
ncbi:LLM class flavin-dependent oxidoreductase [Dactylosporangium salmoneum]|uniref:Luciferase-like domain-containing protein n=1 Tax=Dactylosporangium salmoneum TaxID=53361 RepID=A0ABP5TPI3_9ACTN